MRGYRFDAKLSTVDTGEIELDRALELLDECHRNDEASVAPAEEALSLTQFGLARSDDDFLELTVTAGAVHFHTDAIAAKGVRKLFRRSLDVTLHSRDEARRLLRAYFELPRPAFEEALAASRD
jgi:hypothetical protein